MRDLRHFWLPLRLAGGMALFLVAACSSGSGSGDATDDAMALNKQKIDAADVTQKQEADARFLVKATSNALLEVELGKLAQVRATAPEVRTYGSHLIQNRLELLAALRTLADAKKLALPPTLGDDEQAAFHDASTQTGTQLDKHIMALLVKAQKHDEDDFDDMSSDAYDGDIRGFAAKYHAPVQEQLDGAKEVAKTADKLP